MSGAFICWHSGDVATFDVHVGCNTAVRFVAFGIDCLEMKFMRGAKEIGFGRFELVTGFEAAVVDIREILQVSRDERVSVENIIKEETYRLIQIRRIPPGRSLNESLIEFNVRPRAGIPVTSIVFA